MRRPGSSSCLLLPKGGEDSSDDYPALPSPLSVTVMHREELPSYSCERFFLLSELQVHAYSAVFLSELRKEGCSTESTTEGDSSDEINDDFDTNTNNNKRNELAPFAVVYMLWRPDLDCPPAEYAERVLLPTIRQIQSQRKVVPSPSTTMSDTLKLSGTISPPKDKSKKPTRQDVKKGDGKRLFADDENSSADDDDDEGSIESIEIDQENSSDGTADKPEISLYLVVDRLSLPPKQDFDESVDPLTAVERINKSRAQHQHKEEQIAQELAQYVAKHEELRRLCEGITVGLSNHVRAAPGLEVCVNAVTLGAKDRRRHASAKGAATTTTTKKKSNSLVGIITDQFEDLVGFDPDQETDAAQGVKQMRISTEWNGQGNLQSFAERVQAQWRRERGLPQVQASPVAAQRAPRRAGMELTSDDEDHEPSPDQKAFEEQFYNSAMIVLIGCYIWFHLRGEVDFAEFFWLCVNPARWMDGLIQHLRSI